MSGEFTPTTKQVRDGYRYDPEAEYHDPITPHHVTNGRAFDRWYAAEIAAAKAEALREFADAVLLQFAAKGEGEDDLLKTTPGFIAGIARARADQIEARS